MNRRLLAAAAVCLSAVLTLIGCDTATSPGSSSQESTTSQELVVYSARKEHLIKPLFDKFTEQTGIKVNYVTDKAGPLLARLQAEGDRSPADILMTVDAGNLWQAAEVGVLQPITSDTLNRNVPSHLRDENGQWYGLTIRARTLVYSTDRLDPKKLSTYEDLATPAWKGKLCLRTSKKVYNQSLIATMISALGEQPTESMVKGWVDNLAVPPFSNDTKVMEAIVAGQCDVGIVNSYYFGRLQKKQADLPLALYWPNQGDSDRRGVHVNISGAGVTKASQKVALAQKLIEWLSEGEAQALLMSLNMEYPVLEKVTYSEQLQQWGEFTADTTPVAEAGRLQTEAVKLMDRAGYR